MSSTSQLTTFSDLYTDLLQRVRVSTGVTATVEQAKRYINIALQDIHLGFDYKLPWCEQSSYIRTNPPYTDGTLTATQGSTTLTGSGTLWNTANAYGSTNAGKNGKFLIEGVEDVHRVSTVASDTSVGLSNKYIGETTAGLTYTYFQDEYTLGSSFLRPVDFQIFSPAMGIELISRADFRRRFPVVRTSGRPRVACIIDSVTERRVVFYPYPDKAYTIPFSYITSVVALTSAESGLTSMTSDTDVPTMPLRYRHAILYHAIYHWYRDKKDDARSQLAQSEYNDIMLRIVNDHDIATHTKAQFQPAASSYHSSAYAPYSRRSGRLTYDLHDEWDSFKR